MHPTWIEVDTSALAENARALRAITPASAALGVLVKANAYGHGLEIGARAALAGGADQLIVAGLQEALDLRATGIRAPILVVYPIPPDAVADAAAADIAVCVSGLSSVERTLDAWGAARTNGGPLRLHLEVDTGMGRGGVAPDAARQAVRAIRMADRVELSGIWSHLADGRDPTVSGEQAARFDAMLADLSDEGRAMPTRHLLASEGLLAATAPAYDLVRIGLAFYGELGLGFQVHPERAEAAARLRPALTIKARPVRLETLPSGASLGYGGEWTAARESRVATVAIGYADGWPRASWPGSTALAGGKRVPLVGRVSMDSVCADVTDVPGFGPGDEIVLLGAQGADRISVDEIARHRRTIPNEVLSTLGPRLPRVAVASAD